MTPAVSITDAFVLYDAPGGGVAALQGLTLEVSRGEVVVLLGPSGSGKTTLLRVVAGFEHLAAGSARVLDVDVGRLTPRAADAYRASTLGLLDQHYARSLSPDLSCLRTVALQLELRGHDSRAARRAAAALLDRVGLAGREDDLPGSLSGGEQQRVAVCAAVAHRPGLLLADEPAGELDAASAETVYGLLAALVHETGATALVVTHDDAATAVADRIVHVRDGRIVEEGAPGRPSRLVVARGGWVRLPEPLLRELGSPSRLDAAPAGSTLALSAEGAAPERAAVASAPGRAGPGEPVAELRRVTMRYGGGAGRVVLDELDAVFAASALTAVVGRSGSGKTTLLHLLAGLERATAGEVALLGRALGGLGRGELAGLRREHVALVTQEPGLVPYLSALENVELALQLRGRADPVAHAREALHAVGLEERLRLPAARLSAGERQRVAIARALAAEVPLLLLDEPTARLDEDNARGVAALLVEAAHDRGIAVVCATHDLPLVDVADAVLELDRVTRDTSRAC